MSLLSVSYSSFVFLAASSPLSPLQLLHYLSCSDFLLYSPF
jgi:hypothetical protein